MSCECVGCVFGVALLNGVSLGCLAGVFLGSVLGASQEHLRGVTGISQGCLMFFLGVVSLGVVLCCFELFWGFSLVFRWGVSRVSGGCIWRLMLCHKGCSIDVVLVVSLGCHMGFSCVSVFWKSSTPFTETC